LPNFIQIRFETTEPAFSKTVASATSYDKNNNNNKTSSDMGSVRDPKGKAVSVAVKSMKSTQQSGSISTAYL